MSMQRNQRKGRKGLLNRKSCSMKWVRNIGVFVIVVVLFCLEGTGMPVKEANAAAGQVYSCTIHPCYSHPVTGEIEDSGGESSYATGQGMVSGVLGTTGMLEVTDGGSYYLTFRMSLMDYTTNQSFTVQKKEDSGWSETAIGVTATGEDENGTTADVCVQVPQKDCIVRGTMYVEPMGRDVIFYLYPSDFQSGSPSDMKATIVTEKSEKKKSGTQIDTEQAESDRESSASANETEGSSMQSTKDAKSADSENGTSMATDSSAAKTDSETDEQINSAQGLSLSTAVDAEVADASADTSEVVSSDASMSVGAWILVLTVSLTCSGLILIGVSAALVYYFRKNWRRWGEEMEDDEEE